MSDCGAGGAGASSEDCIFCGSKVVSINGSKGAVAALRVHHRRYCKPLARLLLLAEVPPWRLHVRVCGACILLPLIVFQDLHKPVCSETNNSNGHSVRHFQNTRSLVSRHCSRLCARSRPYSLIEKHCGEPLGARPPSALDIGAKPTVPHL